MSFNPQAENINLSKLNLGHTYSFAFHGMCLVLDHKYDEKTIPYALVEQLGPDGGRLKLPHMYRVYKDKMIRED